MIRDDARTEQKERGVFVFVLLTYGVILYRYPTPASPEPLRHIRGSLCLTSVLILEKKSCSHYGLVLTMIHFSADDRKRNKATHEERVQLGNRSGDILFHRQLGINCSQTATQSPLYGVQSTEYCCHYLDYGVLRNTMEYSVRWSSLILTHWIGRENFFLLVEFCPIGNIQQGGETRQ